MINIIIILLSSTILYFFKNNDAITISTISITTIILIIFGERFKFEEIIESNGLPGREAWLPIIMIGVFFHLGYVDTNLVIETFNEKIDIILLIFSFAMISYGMAQSGSFEYLAYKIVEKCGGNTNRLILYLFLLSSILTIITSNDIVILILTPIIYSICIHAHIKNSKLLLLSQFVAANTLSMGLMIGSPTNIIIAEQLDINFFNYLNRMLVPALLSFSISFAVVAYININYKDNKSKAAKLFADWSFNNNYQLPAYSPWKHYTQEMKNWAYIFLVSVIFLIVISNLHMRLIWSAIPTMCIVTLYIIYRKIIYSKGSSAISVTGAFKNIPYGILSFAISFFIVAKLLAQLDLVELTLIPAFEQFANNNFVGLGVVTVFLSGLLVNVINDLPAAAIIAEILPLINFKDPIYFELATNAALVGVNIGCYVTPVGALAGLIWLNVINNEKKRHKRLKEDLAKDNIFNATIDYVKTPDRIDLVKYGTIHFVIVASLIGLLLPFFDILVWVITSPPDGSIGKTYLEYESKRTYVLLIGIFILIFLFSRFNNIIRNNDIVLGHLSEIFSVFNRFVEWSLRNRLTYTIFISFIFLGSAAFLLNWSESKYMLYHATSDVKALFVGTREFLVWLLTFTSSSYDGDKFPRSMFGQLIAGSLPLVAIGSIIFVIRFTSSNPIGKLRLKLSKGEIPSHRVIIVNYEARLEGFVKAILSNKLTHITLLCNELDFPRASTFIESLDQKKESLNRVFADIIDKDPYASFAKYNLHTANEIFMFSKMTSESDYVNLKLVTKLDSLINMQRVGAAKIVDDFLSKDNHNCQYDFHEELGVIGIPFVLLETSSKRQKALLERSISNLLSVHCYIFEHTELISKYLLTDLTNNIKELNEFFNLSKSSSVDNPLESGYQLIEFDIENKSITVARDFFKNKKRLLSGRELSAHSLNIRNNYEQFKETVLINLEDGSPNSLVDFNVVGLGSKISSNKVMLSFSCASLSSQTSTIYSVLCFDEASFSPTNKINTEVKSASRIFIINYTNSSHALIEKVLEVCGDTEIVVLAKYDQEFPDWLAANSKVSLQIIDHRYELLDSNNQDADTNKLRNIKKGDRVYIFVDYEDFDISEQTTLEIIESIESNLTLNDKNVTQSDIQISVESHNEEMRFLFEHLHVDKIIDTTRIRRSYIELIGSLFYKKQSDYTEIQKKLINADNFFKICSLSEQLKPYITIPASNFNIEGEDGVQINLIGFTIEKARKLVVKFSNPPIDLAFLVKLKIEDKVVIPDNYYLSMEKLKVDKNEVIEEYDLILFFPNF